MDGFRDKCIGGNEKGIFAAGGGFGPGGNRNVVGMAIPHVVDLPISGSDLSIGFSDQIGNELGFKLFGGN